MNELAALFAACHRTPDDDVARLVVADWLQEHDRPAQAELLRVQVALAQPCPLGYPEGYHVDCPCPSCDPLSARESALLRDEAALRWGVLRERKVIAHETEWVEERFKHPVTWVRGLPCVRCTLEELGREECQSCHGTKMVQVYTRDGDYELADCWSCGNPRNRVWQPSPFAIAAARESGASFGVTDREPVYGEGTRNEFRWFATDIPIGQQSPTYTLPRLLFESLPHKYARFVRNNWHEYDTLEAARAALDSAVTRLVHRAAYPQAASATHEGGDV